MGGPVEIAEVEDRLLASSRAVGIPNLVRPKRHVNPEPVDKKRRRHTLKVGLAQLSKIRLAPHDHAQPRAAPAATLEKGAVLTEDAVDVAWSYRER